MDMKKPTIVLVPGAWHFPECYSTFRECLRARGYESSVVALSSVIRDGQKPAKDHYEDARLVRNHVEHVVEKGNDVVVFAHSYGGVPTTDGLSGLGKKDNTNHGIVRIIFCTAIVPVEGQSQISIVTHPDLQAGTPKHFARPSEDGLTMYLIHKDAVGALYADVDSKVVESIRPYLGAHSLQSWLSPVTRCTYREIPSSYVICKQDQAFYAYVQRWLAEQAGIEDCVEIDSSHTPFLSQPEELARMVAELIEKV